MCICTKFFEAVDALNDNKYKYDQSLNMADGLGI